MYRVKAVIVRACPHHLFTIPKKKLLTSGIIDPKKREIKMEKLKPCPFCGGGATLRRGPYGDVFYVICNNENCYASASTRIMTTEKEAIEIWNHRPGEKEAYRRGVQGVPMEGDDKE